MLRRALEVFERAAATGIAEEGEGEATMWDEDDDEAERDEEREAVSVEQEMVSFEAATDAVDQTLGASVEGDDWPATVDWQLDDADERSTNDGPACPVKGEAAQAVAAAARRAKIPPGEVLSPAALRLLIAAAARCGEVRFALKLYRSSSGRDALRPSRYSDDSGNADDGGARREVFEALVEACCHGGDVHAALEVFDDFKALEIKVSKVTLAYLESCCRRYKVPDYRVYDVCAQMRLQVSNKREARLPVPIKTSSHHVRGAVEAAAVGGDDDNDVEDDRDDDENTAELADADAKHSAETAAAAANDPMGKQSHASAAASGTRAAHGNFYTALTRLKRGSKRGGHGDGGGGGASYGQTVGGGGGGGDRRRAKAAEEAWEKTRRERTRDRAAASKSDLAGTGDVEPDLAWLKPDPIGDGYDYYGECRGDADDPDDLLQAELRTEGLGRGGGGRGGESRG